ncbi:MAG: hypothetical protein JF625_23820 [Inquilinus limosus]|uniref:Double-strand break repair protein AddB n=1 Tax=Inquilinus limosus TaxID=171674 RepID=A0A952FRN2_9PROT|nr:hypothetical protein [Inquilinus limosus]
MTPRVFTIPAGGGVADALARGLLAQAAGDPLALGAMTVLLPGRRAGTTLRDAFLRAAEGKPLLLPRLLPVGDIDADALGLAAGETPAVAEALELPPAIQPRQRQILLARLVLARGDQEVGADQAMHLAAALARLLDEVQAEGLGFDRLDGLVPAELAEHWQETLRPGPGRGLAGHAPGRPGDRRRPAGHQPGRDRAAARGRVAAAGRPGAARPGPLHGWRELGPAG